MRKLYHTTLSPYCRKLRLLMHEANIEFRLETVDPRYGSMPPRELAPAGEIPILEDESLTLIGNYAISEYLIDHYDLGRLAGETVGQRANIRRLVDWYDRVFDEQVTQNIVFQKYFKRLYHQGPPDSSAIRLGKHHMQLHLSHLNKLLEENTWLAGDHISLADLSAAAQLSCNDYFGDVPWKGNEAVHEWYSVIKSRPSMRRILSERISGYAPPVFYDNPDF